MKVSVNEQQRVTTLSTEIAPPQVYGASVNIEKFSAATSRLLFNELDTVILGERRVNEYYEFAYQRLIAKGLALHALDIAGERWIEIDDEVDLRRAEEIFR
jgi:choline kinase